MTDNQSPAPQTELEKNMVVLQKSGEIIKQGPTILQNNQAISARVVAVGEKILAEITAKGMDAKLDGIADKWLQTAGTRIAEMKSAREPITQMIALMSTTLIMQENAIDKTKPNSVAAKVQQARNKYATDQLEIQRKKREEEDRKRRKAEQRINILADFEKNLKAQFNDYVAKRKEAFYRHFNGLTLETFDAAEQSLKQAKPAFKFKFEGPYATKTDLHTPEELKELAQQVINENWQNFGDTAVEQDQIVLDDLILKLPGKKAELLELKRIADEKEEARKKQEELDKKLKEEQDEKTRKALERTKELQKKQQEELEDQQKKLQQEQQQRQQQDMDSIQQEKEQANKTAEQHVEMKKLEGETMAVLEMEEAMAEVQHTGKTKVQYQIHIKHSAAYVSIFTLWYERAGKAMPLDKLDSVKLETMRKFCEKLADETGEKIESKFLSYEQIAKAITTRKSSKKSES